MTLYKRTMTIIFESEEWMDSPVLMRKFSSYLHDDGISLVESYFYGTPDDEKYGLREITKVDNSYDILINDKLAFTTNYEFKARDIVRDLVKNEWIAEYFKRTEESTKTEWMAVPGSYAYMDDENFDGEMTTSTIYPSMVYLEDGVELTTKIQRVNDDAFSLTFEIRKDIESITDRKNIEKSIVTIPADDMRNIKQRMVSALERISNAEITHTVDCTTEILSSANYECSKDTIDLVMQ
tara:strand:- start:666 stop:1379 length:714 start_codon:yes stop_codon:yes gene_type:complete